MLAALAIIGAGAIAVIGHTIEKDVAAVGDVIGKDVPRLLSPTIMAAALIGIYLIVRKGH